jgi:hypothetical protein
MEDEEGLASSAQSDNELIAEVVRLLLEGTDPQELLDQGVPPEVLQQAMEIVLSQAPAGGTVDPNAQPAAPVTDGGLAAMSMR